MITPQNIDLIIVSPLTILALIIFAVIVWRLINMATALGAFTGVLWLISVNLLGVGFVVDNDGYKCAASLIWKGSIFFAVAGFVVLYFFIKSLLKQKQRDKWDDTSKGI